VRATRPLLPRELAQVKPPKFNPPYLPTLSPLFSPLQSNPDFCWSVHWLSVLDGQAKAGAPVQSNCEDPISIVRTNNGWVKLTVAAACWTARDRAKRAADVVRILTIWHKIIRYFQEINSVSDDNQLDV